MTRKRTSSTAPFVVLACVACRAPAPRPPSGPPAAKPVAPAPPASTPRWAEARLRSVEEIASAEDGLSAFALGSEVLVLRRAGDRFRLARLEKGKLVDEDAWSRGLPQPDKSSCNRIEGVFGHFPDRLWLIENAGGSMQCHSTFGEYAVWRRNGGAWAKDAAHSPKRDAPAEGVFATWPLGPAVIGTGISNLVGDTLTAPVDAMWPLRPDPWATRAKLRREGWDMISVCASPSGTVDVLSAKEGRFSVESIAAGGARNAVDVSPPHAPEGPCGASDEALVVAGKPSWSVYDRASRAWARVEVPWTHRPTRIDLAGARIVAWTEDAKQRNHVFVASRDDVLRGKPAWTELVGLPEDESGLEVVTWRGDDEVLLLVDRRKLVRASLPPP